MRGKQRTFDWTEGAHFSGQILKGLLTSRIGFAVFDRRLRYRLVNDALAAMHRVPVQDHLGENPRKIIGNAALRIEPALEAVLATGEVIPRCELIGSVPMRPEGVHWTGTHFPIRNARGKITDVGVFVVEAVSEVQNGRAIRTNKKLLERLIVSANQTQEVLFRLLPRDEYDLSRADSEGLIRGVTQASGKHGYHAEDGSPITLSPREREIVCFLANGVSKKEISAALQISAKTVECYRARVFAKLKLDSLASLVRYAVRHHIIEA